MGGINLAGARGESVGGVLRLPGLKTGRSALPYPRLLMMEPTTLSTNCGEWKRVAYVYELSARQVSERPHGEASRGSLSRESCLTLRT